jgi:DNA replication protein DnaC
MDGNLLLENYLKQLKLPTFVKEYKRTARQCSQEKRGYEPFLQQLTELEIQHRRIHTMQRRIKEASFPAEKELAEFDFTAIPTINKKRIIDLAKGDYIRKRECVVMIGQPGTGKTHLAVALGREACRQGKRVKFFTATGLATAYAEARDERTVQKLERFIEQRDLIVLDELGYIPLGRLGAENLFGFFSKCYERTSVIVTSNLPFSAWPEVFGDERLTGALLDRLTHRVHVIEAAGNSYRLQSHDHAAKIETAEKNESHDNTPDAAEQENDMT